MLTYLQSVHINTTYNTVLVCSSSLATRMFTCASLKRLKQGPHRYIGPGPAVRIPDTPVQCSPQALRSKAVSVQASPGGGRGGTGSGAAARRWRPAPASVGRPPGAPGGPWSPGSPARSPFLHRGTEWESVGNTMVR